MIIIGGIHTSVQTINMRKVRTNEVAVNLYTWTTTEGSAKLPIPVGVIDCRYGPRTATEQHELPLTWGTNAIHHLKFAMMVLQYPSWSVVRTNRI